MIKDHLAVMQDLKLYASPKARLTRMLKSGSLIQVRRGLFVDNPQESCKVLASVIYGPSYLSFQYALSFHGLIPERVPVYMSASFGKNKDKHYSTPLGEFSYFYLPQAVYPYGIQRLEEDDLPFLIASPEKALCDAVYKVPGISGIQEIGPLLTENWRMEKDDLARLDQGLIAWLAPLYHRRSVAALAAWFAEDWSECP